MNPATISLLFLFMISVHKNGHPVIKNYRYAVRDTVPAMLLGNFKDDYGIRYTINDSEWIQHPYATYHIIKWNDKEQYLIAKNDPKNHSEAGLYTRIDYMLFTGMEPFQWGFCLSVYDAKTDSIAEVTTHADRQNPKKGCNGFPFSRMKRIQ